MPRNNSKIRWRNTGRRSAVLDRLCHLVFMLLLNIHTRPVASLYNSSSVHSKLVCPLLVPNTRTFKSWYNVFKDNSKEKYLRSCFFPSYMVLQTLQNFYLELHLYLKRPVSYLSQDTGFPQWDLLQTCCRNESRLRQYRFFSASVQFFFHRSSYHRLYVVWETVFI